MSVTEKVYLSKNNLFSIILSADDVDQPLDSITKIQVMEKKGAFVVDSDVDAGAITWPTSTTGEVLFDFGNLDLPAGDKECFLIVFDAQNPEGIVWLDLILEIKDLS